jgi:hypothetical protein
LRGFSGLAAGGLRKQQSAGDDQAEEFDELWMRGPTGSQATASPRIAGRFDLDHPKRPFFSATS